MKQLTQKEYIEDLQAGSRFIRAIHTNPADLTIGELERYIDIETYQTIKDNYCYRYVSMKKRSKDFVFLLEDGTSSYRDFNGKNKYYTHKQILLHINTILEGPGDMCPGKEHVTIFINC